MRRELDRRRLLRGLGTALALPWLGSLLPRPARADAPHPPLRLAFLFVPNGVDMPNWTPTTEGAAFELPSILAPLETVRDEVLVVSGLTLDKARANGDGPGDHARSAAAFLTASQPRKTAGADLHVGVSVDQVVAQHRGAETSLPSLELGIESARQSGSCDSGYSCAYSSSIAWRTAHTPLGKEVHPRLAFERLVAFGGRAATAEARAERLVSRRSVLDYVREDALRLRRALGRKDREKLDEYLAAVRQLERRIESTERVQDRAAHPLAPLLPARVPEDRREHIRLLEDVLVLAFRMDRTRVATFMLANAGSNQPYPFLGVPEGHHELSHHGGDDAKIRKVRAINRFHVSQFAYLLQRLQEVPEGDGTLLDHSVVVYGSGISDGNRHNHEDLPLLVAGRGGGALHPGRHVRYPRETPCANLWLSILGLFGVDVPTFGDATGRLDHL